VDQISFLFANGLIASLLVLFSGALISVLIWLLNKARLFLILGRIWLILKWVLLNPVAWTIGLRWKSQVYRTTHSLVFGAILATSALMGSFYVVVAAAILSVIAIITSYAVWGESEFEQEIRLPDEKRKFIGDFRDEAISWLLFLFFIAPILFARIDSTQEVLDESARSFQYLGVSLKYSAFVIGELIRALPIVDLFEVYGLENPSGVIAIKGVGQHSTFALRILYDAVIVAGILRLFLIFQRQQSGADLRGLVNGIVQGPDARAEKMVDQFRPRGVALVTARSELGSRVNAADDGILRRTADAARVLGQRWIDKGLLEIAVSAYRNGISKLSESENLLAVGKLQHNSGIAYYDIAMLSHSLERLKFLELAIAMYNSSLAVRKKNDEPFLWAMTNNNLGNAHKQSALLKKGNNRKIDLEFAISSYDSALEYWTADIASSEWGTVQSNLGATYSDLALMQDNLSQRAGLEKAIAAYDKALIVRTKRKVPFKWARTQNNRGNALQYLALTHSDDNRSMTLKNSISAYVAALTVRKKRNSPFEWAMTKHNKGKTFFELALVDKSSNQEKHFKQALSDFDDALKIRTNISSPSQYAITHFNRGNVLMKIASLVESPKKKKKKLTSAINSYESALSIWTKQDENAIEHWASAMHNLGQSLIDLYVNDPVNNVRSLDRAILLLTEVYEFYMRLHMEEEFSHVNKLLEHAREIKNN